MDNRTAFALAVLVIVALVADLTLEWGVAGFMAQKVVDLISWMAFWQ